MARSIDNFLSKDEQDMISVFIEKCKQRIFTYNELTGGTPDLLKTEDLRDLKREKYSKWDIALSAMMPYTGNTYRRYIDKQSLNYCAINTFFITFEKILKQEPPFSDYDNILQDLKVGLEQCGASCPCPAGMRD